MDGWDFVGHPVTDESAKEAIEQLKRQNDILTGIAAGNAGAEFVDAIFDGLLDGQNTSEVFWNWWPLAEWAIEAITKAEKEFVGTKLGEARLAVVVSWLRAKVPAPLRFLVTDSMIQKVVQMTFNAAKAGLEVLKDA